MYNPVSTYRIQFNKDYTFRQFSEDLEYILMLGPGSLYASPVFAAVPGSMHGYDVTDPLMINPEIGEHDRLRDISARLKAAGTGWIQDIVPNHMAFHMNNRWLLDVLENGLTSAYAGFFDIDFNHPGSNGKIMVPFLGKEPEDAVKDGELRLDWLENSFVFRYFGLWFPLSPASVYGVFARYDTTMPAEFRKLIKKAEKNDPGKLTLFRKNISRLPEGSGDTMKYINEVQEAVNSDKTFLLELLGEQNYRLSYWRDTLTSINYRRFFTVNSLICLKMEEDETFDAYHGFIMKEIRAGRFTGVRVDHIDGLKKPFYYLDKLRMLVGENTYIITEKILGLREEPVAGAPVQGTSGYDFLGIVNNLFTFKKNYGDLESFYRKITGIKDNLSDIIYERKKLILWDWMQGELDNLTGMLIESGIIENEDDISPEALKTGISEFLVCFPVYKIYSDSLPLASSDRDILKNVMEEALDRNPSAEKALTILAGIFLRHDGYEGALKEKALEFFLRCMQFTGPLMAKGVEDTVMYYYNCFIGHNEVGDEPGSSGISVEEYHGLMEYRQRHWPMTMNSTSTHDTKRGEDVRARLNVITEMPDEWKKHVRQWMKINRENKVKAGNKVAPDNNEEYFIYQTLTGVMIPGENPDEAFFSRIDEYLVKSLREARVNSGWNDPDEEYESAVINFTHRILHPDGEFLKSFGPFLERISAFGIINSLSQLMLKAMSPGIPDFYQGTELWDLSMVDPDNRRPVDYSLRMKLLKTLARHNRHVLGSLFTDLYYSRNDGRIKLWLTYLLMQERRSDPELFLHGKYLPLTVTGRHSGQLIAFARVHENRWYIVAAPLFLSLFPGNEKRKEPGAIDWEDTAILLPETAPGKWNSPYGKTDIPSDGRILLTDVMQVPCPFYLKGALQPSRRSAGVLAHISSLPGRFGTGDLGSEAYDFADVLQSAGQKYWQILPFNPVSEGNAWSPYSSSSAFAGNTMLINPHFLLRNRLISDRLINKEQFIESDHVNFKKASAFRNVILDEAAETFFCSDRPYAKKLFNDFCIAQGTWLNDYVIFKILKNEFDGAPWSEWPENIRNRESHSLSSAERKYEAEIAKEKFAQFLFQQQWQDMKTYCNISGIRIIGDMSFYVNYDSADVWSHPEYFKLNSKKKPLRVAGVPPDFFSAGGQLWNMPVYNWKVMKQDGYQWWLNRIRRNLETCDLIRFDHFRGFSEYWEVPAGEINAVNGKWIEGPGSHFFGKIRDQYPGMPFIAEDLGMIDEKVYRLRDEFNLPGMVVLQFAFGDDLPHSTHAPHNHRFNCVVYTGTHDNNTTKGWYVNELSNKRREEIDRYTGHSPDEATCQNDFIRMAYSSVARIAIIPLQDILGLDEKARLNKPSTTGNNWGWKMKGEDLANADFRELRRMAVIFGRI